MEELGSLKKTINTYSSLIFKIGLVLVILASYFLFSNLTTDLYDTPKFLILFIFTGIMLVMLMLKFTVLGKVVFTRTPLDIPLLLLVVVGIASTLLSPSPYVAILGNQLRINSSLVSIVVYILFYFVVVNSLKSSKEIKWFLNLAVILAQALSAVTLLSYTGIKLLPAPWVTNVNFTTTGSSFSTTAILALLLPFVVIQIIKSTKLIFTACYSLFFAIMGVTIVLTGTPASWIAAIIGLVLSFYLSNINSLINLRHANRPNPVNLIGLAVPLAIVILVAALSFIPPIGNAKNPLYTLSKNFPREIQLGLIPSWKISISTFRDSPFWGSGPATYLFNFTTYKPVEFNASNEWNLRFDSSFNEYLQILATMGAIGLLALLSATALFISSAYPALSTVNRFQPTTSPEENLKPVLAISGLVFFILLALHPATLPVWIIGLFILASFMVINLSNLQRNWTSASGDIKDTLLRIASNVTSHSSSQEIRVDALPGVLLTIVLALVIIAGYFGAKFTLADYHHRLALNAVAQNQGIEAYNQLVTATKLNPYSDLYRLDLAQTNFALANAIATAKGPTEASPSGSLTDQDKQNIQMLLQQSINEGRNAVALSPRSATNWEVLGLLYRQIAGVAENALVFSLDSYGRAIMQDPLNPNLRLSVGGVYYAIQNYDMAIRFFTDAINLKQDFANAYYNLSVALRDKGDLANAQAMAEKLLTLIDKSLPDYKVANDYLEDLKKKAQAGGTQTPTQSNEESTVQQPPAAQTEGALQSKKLPKVIDLEQLEEIATPEAIKKPEETPTPSTNP